MNANPIVTVAPAYRGGWLAICSCSWRLWAVTRPPVDVEAERHRAKCAKKGRE